ncbi:MAG: VOC family protein [Saprospiraceae bacterium]|nr:VOC family protein [Saprospiraceae bacterium]
MNVNIYPCIWFDNDALAAAEFYSKAFADTKIVTASPMAVKFQIKEIDLMGLNGGPMFKANPSISFYVTIEDLSELDHTWSVLISGGQELMPLGTYPWSQKYGWLQDKYGVSWQLSFGKKTDVGQSVCPSLMFTNAMNGYTTQAIDFYTSIFKDSSVVGIMKYEAGEPDIEGNVKHAQFKLLDQVFMAMDSSISHQFIFNEGISLVVECNTQEEIDYYWTKLTEGGAEVQCGWLKDKFGVSWQIVPSILPVLMSDSEKAPKVIAAFMQMIKFDIAALEAAANAKV